MAQIDETWEPKEVDRPHHKFDGCKDVLRGINCGGKSGWRSETILAELAARGKTPEWFAQKLANIIDCGKPRERQRALEVIQKIVAQSEGAKVEVKDLRNKTTKELEEAYGQFVKECQSQGVFEGPN